MNLPSLKTYDRLREVQMTALTAQIVAGGVVEDWQLDRLLPPDLADAPLARRRLRVMIEAEASRLLAAAAIRRSANSRRPSQANRRLPVQRFATDRPANVRRSIDPSS